VTRVGIMWSRLSRHAWSRHGGLLWLCEDSNVAGRPPGACNRTVNIRYMIRNQHESHGQHSGPAQPADPARERPPRPRQNTSPRQHRPDSKPDPGADTPRTLRARGGSPPRGQAHRPTGPDQGRTPTGTPRPPTHTSHKPHGSTVQTIGKDVRIRREKRDRTSVDKTHLAYLPT